MRTLSEITKENLNLSDNEKRIHDAMTELSEWMVKHHMVIAQGRFFGFEMSLTGEAKDALRHILVDSEHGVTAIGNTLTLH